MVTIICSAIWINNKKIHEQQPLNINIGFVVCGRRHHNCYQTIKDLLGIDVNEYFKKIGYTDEDYRLHQGFLTSDNRFVDRKEGWNIAKNSNQILYGLKACEEFESLTSENLFYDFD